jgi:ATP-binding cassette, subfamily B, bacterial
LWRKTAIQSHPNALSGRLPFVLPYKPQLALAALFLLMAALSTLVFPVALRYLIDSNTGSKVGGSGVNLLQIHFLALFGVACALGVFSAARFYRVSWLGERITSDARNAMNQSRAAFAGVSAPPRHAAGVNEHGLSRPPWHICAAF